MIRKEASPDVIEKIKTFGRVPFDQFKELIRMGEIIPTVKLKTPRTIFYDGNTRNFLYINPYYGEFQKCGEWSNLINEK